MCFGCFVILGKMRSQVNVVTRTDVFKKVGGIHNGGLLSSSVLVFERGSKNPRTCSHINILFAKKPRS